MTDPTPRDRLILGGLLLLVFAGRAWRADQPILEGYVGRQVPTAMVASNLRRGSGFLAPQLDTGPFPNLFLVEPPVHAQLAAWLATATGLPLDAVGRLVAALGTTLAAWGLFGLVSRREGRAAAFASVVALAAFPVTIRYGRAFQPDTLAMGLVVAGLNLRDRPGGRLAGWVVLAIGLAQKATWSFALVPLLGAILAGVPWRRRWLAATAILPALAWYAFAAWTLADGAGGSTASRDNATNWLARLAPASLVEPGRYWVVGRDLIWRAFTPVGTALAIVGVWLGWRSADRIWRSWTIAAAGMMVVLFGKLHHDYYWLIMAPPVAAWIGIGVGRLAGLQASRRGRCADHPNSSSVTLEEVRTAAPTEKEGRPWSKAVLAIGALLCLVALGLIQSRSTWRTPDEWRDATALADAIRRHTPADALVIAPEAILHLGGRRGCRLEYDEAGARRAANEWRPDPPYRESDPSALVRFYRDRAGAGHFAGLDGPASRPLIEAARREPGARVVEDRPGRYLLIAFDGPPAPRGHPP